MARCKKPKLENNGFIFLILAFIKKKMTKQQTLIYLLVIQVIYLVGAVLIALMDNDATQYATIAMQMFESGSYLEVAYRDIDYLDKPPLLFWLSSLSFSIFGISHFAYRLPSIIVNLLGIYATFKLAESLYGRQAGLLAALVFASAFGIVLFNHDVRTDTMLTAFVIFSIWQIMAYIQQGRISHLIMGFVGIGLAMLVKGPIGLMAPVLAIGCQVLYQKQWRFIFHWPWLPGLVIVLLILSPMLIGLYNQHGYTGLEFYFWTQSFGRLTGENVWVDTTGPMFFVHSFLWSFLPWSLLALVAYVKKWVLVFKDFKSARKQEVLTLGGITLVFIAMSLSQYKLPHYVFVVYPLIAILTASFLSDFLENAASFKFFRVISITQHVVNILLWVAIIFISTYVFPLRSIPIWIALVSVLVLSILSMIKKSVGFSQLFKSTLLTAIGLAIVLNMHFYPTLSRYQAGVTAGEFIKEKDYPAEKLLAYIAFRSSLDFYSGRIIPETKDSEVMMQAVETHDTLIMFTNEQGLIDLQERQINYMEIQRFKDFHISTLTLPFLNPATREDATDVAYLLMITNNSAVQ
jgi:4-amino-4-deoxy-L-arabinose transferase-like glycosyltransferase